MVNEAQRSWYGQAWPFACLCLLVASRWLLESADPRWVSTSRTQSLACSLLACLLVAMALAPFPAGRRSRLGRELVQQTQQAFPLKLTLGTLLVLGGEQMAELVSDRSIGSRDATLALALAPVVVAVLTAASSEVAEGNLPGRLWPALAALLGLLLLLPQPALSGFRAWAGLALMPLLVGAGAVLVARGASAGAAVPRKRVLFFEAGGCLVAATVFALTAVQRPGEMAAGWTIRAAGLDGCTATLTLLALHRLGAARWSAQFFVIPLLALGEGLLLLRPSLDVRFWIGLGLLTIGAVRQLWPEASGPEGASLWRPPAV